MFKPFGSNDFDQMLLLNSPDNHLLLVNKKKLNNLSILFALCIVHRRPFQCKEFSLSLMKLEFDFTYIGIPANIIYLIYTIVHIVERCVFFVCLLAKCRFNKSDFIDNLIISNLIAFRLVLIMSSADE